MVRGLTVAWTYLLAEPRVLVAPRGFPFFASQADSLSLSSGQAEGTATIPVCDRDVWLLYDVVPFCMSQVVEIIQCCLLCNVAI